MKKWLLCTGKKWVRHLA